MVGAEPAHRVSAEEHAVAVDLELPARGVDRVLDVLRRARLAPARILLRRVLRHGGRGWRGDDERRVVERRHHRPRLQVEVLLRRCVGGFAVPAVHEHEQRRGLREVQPLRHEVVDPPRVRPGERRVIRQRRRLRHGNGRAGRKHQGNDDCNRDQTHDIFHVLLLLNVNVSSTAVSISQS